MDNYNKEKPKSTAPFRRIRVEHEVIDEFPGAGLANFLSLRGRKVIQSCGSLWHSVPNRFYMRLPYQLALEPNQRTISEMLQVNSMFGVRFSSKQWPGLPGGAYVYRGREYNLGIVHPKHRPRVKKGLQKFEYRSVNQNDLINQGIELNLETMLRQGYFDHEFGDIESWTRFVNAISICPEIDAVGAYDGNRLSAYMVICQENGWINILHQMSRKDDLHLFPNHALTYWVTKSATEDDSIDGVCYGLMSLKSLPGLHEYKLRFGYEINRMNSVILFNPRIDTLFNNRLAYWGIGLLRKINPTNQKFETIQTIIRGAGLSSYLLDYQDKS